VRRSIRIVFFALPALALLAVAAAFLALRASLPRLDGERLLSGLAAPATISRDALGVLTVEAAGARDAAFALGYATAQERFFEMDLLRRAAAGELAEVFGAAALPVDRERRLHRFRTRARTVLAGLDEASRSRAQAYAEGVNAGLADLAARPWQYSLLRQRPAPWRAEDSLLVGYAMFFDLQDETNARELATARLRASLPPAYTDFVLAAGNGWDAPIAGEPLALPPIPPAEVVDLRRLDRRHFGREVDVTTDYAVGSNGWAVDGRLTAHGGALVANDVHLGLRVPNIWLRARLRFAGAGGAVDVAGVTLPGFPGIVIGANGRIAWAFTNSYGDWLDWVEVKFTDAARRRYRTADGEREVETWVETIAVRGAAAETITVRETVFGPIAHESDAFGTLALAWTAHHPAAVNLGLLRFEAASDVGLALRIAETTGMPAQNLIVGDAQGAIGWTVIGALPRRTGFDASRPADWSQPGVGWLGWRSADDLPRVLAPPSGRLWSANARMVDGEALAAIGDGGYRLGARAGQIRDGLLARPRFSEADMLAIQLDDRALFLRRWWQLLRNVLAGHDGEPALAELWRATASWSGRAAVDSADYRLVREFREQVQRRVLDGLAAPMRAVDPEFVLPRLDQVEGPLWELLQARPPHLLPPQYADWDALLLAAARAVASELGGLPGGLAARTWGERMQPAIRHPLSRAVPWLAPLLDMPRQPLPGDVAMPRVQGQGFGASLRMAVAPGREADGYLHMPGGQSGHPLSPFYGAGHADWAQGRPTPFLPGAPRHTLRLRPVH
jgi:penicillin amidase